MVPIDGHQHEICFNMHIKGVLTNQGDWTDWTGWTGNFAPPRVSQAWRASFGFRGRFFAGSGRTSTSSGEGFYLICKSWGLRSIGLILLQTGSLPDN